MIKSFLWCRRIFEDRELSITVDRYLSANGRAVGSKRQSEGSAK